MVAHRLLELGQVVEACGCARMLRAEGFLVDGQRSLVERLGLIKGMKGLIEQA